MRTAHIRIHETDTTWQTRPACNPATADLFFPISYTDPAGLETVAKAKAICDRCPIRQSCRTNALHDEGSKAPEARSGIRGGLTPDERADLAGVTTGRKNRKAAA